MGKTYIRPNAVGADRAIANIQEGLIEELPWLDMAFGRAERRVTATNITGQTYYFPAVFVGSANFNGLNKNEYISAEPSDVVGNSCFFELDDPQDFSSGLTLDDAIVVLPVSVVFWVDMRRIYALGVRNTEEVKLMAVRALKELNLGVGGTVEVESVYERTENVYRGYGLREVETEYLMHPYYGFRISFTMRVGTICYPSPARATYVMRYIDQQTLNPLREDTIYSEEIGSEFIFPSIPNIPDYINDALWHSEISGGNTFTPGSTIIVEESRTFYAHYSEDIPVVNPNLWRDTVAMDIANTEIWDRLNGNSSIAPYKINGYSVANLNGSGIYMSIAQSTVEPLPIGVYCLSFYGRNMSESAYFRIVQRGINPLILVRVDGVEIPLEEETQFSVLGYFRLIEIVIDVQVSTDLPFIPYVPANTAQNPSNIFAYKLEVGDHRTGEL